jgi:hypothetical protein
MTDYISKYPAAFDTSSVHTTSYLNSSYFGYFACNPANSLTGAEYYNQWYSSDYSAQKFSIDLGSAFVIKRLYIENAHHNGGYTDYGLKNVLVYGTNSSSAFDDTTYSTTTDLTLLSTIEVAQHVVYDIEDPQYFVFSNSTAYRYIVLRIADNWRSGGQISVRRIEFQTEGVQDVSYTGTGGAVGGGHADITYSPMEWIGVGGGVGGGEAVVNRESLKNGIGGGVGGGHATISHTYIISYSQTGVGGGVAGGSATTSRQLAIVVNGHISPVIGELNSYLLTNILLDGHIIAPMGIINSNLGLAGHIVAPMSVMNSTLLVSNFWDCRLINRIGVINATLDIAETSVDLDGHLISEIGAINSILINTNAFYVHLNPVNSSIISELSIGYVAGIMHGHIETEMSKVKSCLNMEETETLLTYVLI